MKVVWRSGPWQVSEGEGIGDGQRRSGEGAVASFFLMKKSTVPEAELMAMLHGASAPPSASDLQFGSSPLANADVSFRL